MNLWDEFGDSASIWTYQLGNLNSWYCLFCLIPQVMTSLWSHYWLQAITVVSLVFFFQRSHACAETDLATRRLLPRETTRQITNSARVSRVTLAQGWSTIRGEAEMSGPSVWLQIERWEIGVSVPLLEDLCSSTRGLCVCVCVCFLTPGHVSYSTRA